MNKEYIRMRDVTHAFRTTRAEADSIDLLVRVSGLTKQEYLYKKAIDTEIKVVGTPRVNNLLRKEVKTLIDEISTIKPSEISEENFTRLEMIIKIYSELEKF